MSASETHRDALVRGLDFIYADATLTRRKRASGPRGGYTDGPSTPIRAKLDNDRATLAKQNIGPDRVLVYILHGSTEPKEADRITLGGETFTVESVRTPAPGAVHECECSLD